MNIFCNENVYYYNGFKIYSNFPISLDNIEETYIINHIRDRYKHITINTEIYILDDQLYECLNSNVFIEVKGVSLSETLKHINIPNISFTTNIPNKFDISFNGILSDFMLELHENADIHWTIKDRKINFYKCNTITEHDLSFAANVSDLIKQIEIIGKSIDKGFSVMHSNNIASIIGSCKAQNKIKECINVFRHKSQQSVKLDLCVCEVRRSSAFDIRSLSIINGIINVFNQELTEITRKISRFFEKSYNVKCYVRNITSCSVVNGQKLEIQTGMCNQHDMIHEKIKIPEHNSSNLKIECNINDDESIMLKIKCHNQDIAGSSSVSHLSCDGNIVVNSGDCKVIFSRIEERNLHPQGIWSLFGNRKTEYVFTIVFVCVNQGENYENI